MKKILLLLLVGILGPITGTILAQTVHYTLANSQHIQEAGTDYYQVDIMISATTPLKLGSGQLYFNYNPAAFGENIAANNRVEVITSAGHILANKDNWLQAVDVYGDFIGNDNTRTRFSFSWQQSKEGDCIDINVNDTPRPLFRLKIAVQDMTQSPGLCFESGGLYTGQTFTHCGPNDGSCGLNDEDCRTEPGNQIISETFDCSESILPVELLAFTVNKVSAAEIHLNWATSAEINTSHFEVERSPEGSTWTLIGQEKAAGNSFSTLHYAFIDAQLSPPTNEHITWYYRLRMVDLDGSFAYSPVRTIRLEEQLGIKWGIFPNPATQEVNIHYGDLAGTLKNGRLKLYAPDGSIAVLQSIDPAGNKIYFPAGLAPGLYQIILCAEQGQVVATDRIVLSR